MGVIERHSELGSRSQALISTSVKTPCSNWKSFEFLILSSFRGTPFSFNFFRFRSADASCLASSVDRSRERECFFFIVLQLHCCGQHVTFTKTTSDGDQDSTGRRSFTVETSLRTSVTSILIIISCSIFSLLVYRVEAFPQ